MQYLILIQVKTTPRNSIRVKDISISEHDRKTDNNVFNRLLSRCLHSYVKGTHT